MIVVNKNIHKFTSCFSKSFSRRKPKKMEENVRKKKPHLKGIKLNY